MENTNNLFKICARCLFRVPLSKPMCKTCGSREFVTSDEKNDVRKRQAIMIEWPSLLNLQSRLFTKNAPSEPADNLFS